MTHWNESVWLDVHEYLEWVQLDKGKLLLIVANKKATIEEERFIDANMNRVYAGGDETSYEYKRAKELEPLFDECDIIVDIHSISQWDACPMVICPSSMKKYAEDTAPTEILFVDELVKTWALLSYAYGKWKKVLWIECGRHDEESAATIWITMVLNVLRYEGMLSWPITVPKKKIYSIHKEIISHHEKLQFTREFKQFESLEQWYCYAVGETESHVSSTKWPTEYIALMTPNDHIKIGDGIGFIFHTVEE